MAKGGNKGGGAGKGLGNSVILYKVGDGNAEFSRMELNTVNPDGATLAPTSSKLIKDVTDTVLSDCPEQYRGGLTDKVEKIVRAKISASKPWETVSINFADILAKLNETVEAKGKGKKAKLPNGDDGPSDEDDDSEDEGVIDLNESEPAPVGEPQQF